MKAVSRGVWHVSRMRIMMRGAVEVRDHAEVFTFS